MNGGSRTTQSHALGISHPAKGSPCRNRRNPIRGGNISPGTGGAVISPPMPSLTMELAWNRKQSGGDDWHPPLVVTDKPVAHGFIGDNFVTGFFLIDNTMGDIIMALSLSSLFTRMTDAQTFALADACGAARDATNKGEDALCGQFIASAAVAFASGVSVEDTLSDWYKAYAIHSGAKVSDKGRVSTGEMEPAAAEAFKRARNSFNVAKSAIVGAQRAAESGDVAITDGGSLFLRQDGMPRSKGELLAFAKDAKAAREGTDLQKAIARLTASFKAAAKLTDDERAIFEDTCRAYLANPALAIGGEDEDGE